VLFEAAQSRVLLGAPFDLALEELVAGVDYQVGLEVALGDKLGLAVVAGEGALACVHADVGLEVADVFKLFQAVVEGAD